MDNASAKPVGPRAAAADSGGAPNARRSLPRRLFAALIANEKIRFLVIGGINTVVSYAIFAALQLTIGKNVGYIVDLYISYVVGIVFAFFLHRRFTFQVVGGKILVDLARFASVYIVTLAINTIALPLLVELAGLNPLLAQALIICVTTIGSYFGHRFFSFRRKAHTTPDSDKA